MMLKLKCFGSTLFSFAMHPQLYKEKDVLCLISFLESLSNQTSTTINIVSVYSVYIPYKEKARA